MHTSRDSNRDYSKLGLILLDHLDTQLACAWMAFHFGAS
jgi:hypothetical protein